jgi:hypothetical protein
MNAINVADIVEENGKTIRQNNQEKTHNIPVGTLVEVDWHTWHGAGACEVTRARLWVISQDRDCDGTPLYTLCKIPKDSWSKMSMFLDLLDEGRWELKEEVTQNIYYNAHSGFGEEHLKVIPVTEELKSGKGALEETELVPHVNHAPLASVAAIYYHMQRLENLLVDPDAKAIARAVLDECIHCSPTLKELKW